MIKEKEIPLKEMLKKRGEIFNLLGGQSSNRWADLYSMAPMQKGTIIVIKAKNKNQVCGVGLFSATGKLRMTPMYITDGYFSDDNLPKTGDELDIYLYNEKENTMSLCVCNYYDRRSGIYFDILTQGKFGDSFQITSIEDIGDKEIK